jgi:hypothetical protein
MMRKKQDQDDGKKCLAAEIVTIFAVAVSCTEEDLKQMRSEVKKDSSTVVSGEIGSGAHDGWCPR